MCRVHNILMAILIKGAKSALKIKGINSQGKRNSRKYCKVYLNMDVTDMTDHSNM